MKKFISVLSHIKWISDLVLLIIQQHKAEAPTEPTAAGTPPVAQSATAAKN